MRERRERGAEPPLCAPSPEPHAEPAPEQREGTMRGGNPPTPWRGRGRSAERETPRPSLFSPGAGRGSPAGLSQASPVPPRGRRRAEGQSGGGRSLSAASSHPHGKPSSPRLGRTPPLLSPSRLPLPWPPSPPVRQSPARRSRPPSPSSRCNGSGAESGAEPSGSSCRRQALNPLPAGKKPTGERGRLTPPARRRRGCRSRAAPFAGRGERLPPAGARVSPPTPSPSSIGRPRTRRGRGIGTGTPARVAGAQWWLRGGPPPPRCPGARRHYSPSFPLPWLGSRRMVIDGMGKKGFYSGLGSPAW